MSLPRQLVLRPEYRSVQQGQGEGSAISREEARGGAPGTTQEGDPAGPPRQPQSPLDQEACMANLPWILGMIAIFYFLLIRPQQKQEKQRRAMLGALKKGDKVVSSGGIHGTITSINDDTVVVRVESNVKLTFDRAHIGRVMGAGSGDGAGESKDGDK